MTRLQKRLKERAEKIGRISRARYNITAQESAEFLQLLLRHMRQWLKHFKADLLDSKIFLSKPCEFSEKEKFSRRHVTDGPLVLFQIMKDMQAYKRQWEEMSFNNLDPDELPPPAFITEKLVDLIKKCPVVQRSPGRFNRRGEFLLEHIGDRFIAYGARETLSFTRSSVRLRHGPVSAAVTREDLEAEPEQDLGGFLCGKVNGKKARNERNNLRSIASCDEGQLRAATGQGRYFRGVESVALERLVKGYICDDDRDVLARISDFWMNRPDPEHSLNTGGGPHREDDIDEVSNDGEFGDAFCKPEKLERRVVYPDLMDTAKELLGEYPEFFQLLLDAKARRCPIGRTIFEPIVRLAFRGKIQRQSNSTGVVISDLISLLPGHSVNRFLLHDAIEAPCRPNPKHRVASPQAIDEFLIGNPRPIESFFKGDIPDGVSQPPNIFFLLPPDEYPQELAVTALTTTYASTIIVGIKSRGADQDSNFQTILGLIWKGLFSGKRKLAQRFMYLELDGRPKPEVSSLLIRTALEITKLHNLPDFFKLATGHSNDQQKRSRIERWVKQGGLLDVYRKRAAGEICRYPTSFGPLLLPGQADASVQSEEPLVSDGEDFSTNNEFSDEEASLDLQEDGSAPDFDDGDSSSGDYMDTVTTEFNNLDMNDGVRVEEVVCRVFDKYPDRRPHFTISSEDESGILHSPDGRDSHTQRHEHQDTADPEIQARISRHRHFFREIVSNIAKLCLISHDIKCGGGLNMATFFDQAWLMFLAANSSEEGINRLLILLTDFAFHNKATQYILGRETWPKTMFDTLPALAISQPEAMSRNYGQYIGIAPMPDGNYWFYAGSATKVTPSDDGLTGIAARMHLGHHAILNKGKGWIDKARREGHMNVHLMQLSGVIITIIAAASCASALPKPITAKRALGGILMCQGANATGLCHYETYTLGECHEVPKEFWQNTRTFAPDGDNFYCWPRVGVCDDICTSPTGCTFGGAFYFDNPAKYDLAKISWDKSLVSFDCHKNETTTA
ncbi:hypothetical protein F5B21DRAFT_506474 [Xylaria acuta]|nr:hypothetical protein F5B21DRAFT_506474 [Xylaria acuta]